MLPRINNRAITDAISCYVIEERNGIFDLEMVYPINGKVYNEFALGAEIRAKPSQHLNYFYADSMATFEIYKITRGIGSTINIYAHHISYRLNKVVCKPFSAGSKAQALKALQEMSVPQTHGFRFNCETDITKDYKLPTPRSIRNVLGGMEGSILDVYGTDEIVWRDSEVYLSDHRGAEQPLTIQYGVNMTSFDQTLDNDDLITAIFPYWVDKTGEYSTGPVEKPFKVMLPELYLESEYADQYPRTMCVPVDLTDRFKTIPTVDQLRAEAQAYLDKAPETTISDNIKLSFADLRQAARPSPPWQTYQLPSIGLCDTISVNYPHLGIKGKAKIVKVKFNVLRDRYEEIELGDLRRGLHL